MLGNERKRRKGARQRNLKYALRFHKISLLQMMQDSAVYRSILNEAIHDNVNTMNSI